MLKSFDITGGNFAELLNLNVGVVAALAAAPVATAGGVSVSAVHGNHQNHHQLQLQHHHHQQHQQQQQVHQNNSNLALMNINNINKKIALDNNNASSMKSAKLRVHPYLLREPQQQQQLQLQQIQHHHHHRALLQHPQQQQLHQLQLQHHQRMLKEAAAVAAAVGSSASEAVGAAVVTPAMADSGAVKTVAGFVLSNMNASAVEVASGGTVAVGDDAGGSGDAGNGNAEQTAVSELIKAEPDSISQNDTNILGLAGTSATTNSVENVVQTTSNNDGSDTVCMEIALRDDAVEMNDIGGDVEFEKDQPDPDNIKMFVGQVPKTMDELQLKKMFEEYGRVHTINVLRDKLTTQSRGCCFVTYYTRKAALKAQDALHNIKTLPGMHHPIQMKPADSENRNERKLFVGMLNKKYNESEVRQLFAGHGTIEECTVLRDQNGQSKGCAFVTFSTKQAAIGAIKNLHQSQTMEGCSAPLVVKFADTQKEKDQKKLQQLQATLCGNGLTTNPVSTPSVITRSNPTVQALTAPALAQSAAAIAATPSIIAANPPQQTSPYLAADALATPSQMQYFQQLQTFGIHPQFLQGLNFPPDHSATALSAATGLIAPMSMQSLVSLSALNPSAAAAAAAQHQYHHSQHQHPHLTHPHLSAAVPASPTQPIPAQLANTQQPGSTTLWTGTDALANPYATSLSHLTNGTFATATAPLTASALSAAAAGVAGKQIEGPEGSNLFIYHLPQEFNDTDLASTFLPFGNVLSAKVFIDKITNLSKCFGFVSFDNPHSANAAIQAMHGFQIGTKRLKVQLKRSKDAAKPY